MDPEVAAALTCPHDGGQLVERARALGCPHGHRFDLARQGYATLTASRPPHGGDSPEMLDRRMRVHGAGVLARVHAAVVRAAVVAPAGGHDPGSEPDDGSQHSDRERPTPLVGIVCEVGAGPGTYLAAVLDAMPDRAGLAVDVAKAAARRAARCHPRADAIVADVWDGLPLRTGSVAVLLDVFAPRNTAEFARLVVPGGTLVVATPDPDHLVELRERFGMLGIPGGKGTRIAAELAPAFALGGVESIRTKVSVAADLAVDLATMGPSGHHLDPADPEATGPGVDAAPIEVTIATTVTRFERTTDIGT
ncbi:MAG: hypothetical protein R6V28_05115 [Nitriliruptoraceae bacterium]